MTSNQFYGGLNRRFEKRAALLRRLGFKYRVVCDGVAVFTRKLFRERNLTASSVLYANGTAWRDLLRENLRHGGA